jgi:hypothetical protein
VTNPRLLLRMFRGRAQDLAMASLSLESRLVRLRRRRRVNYLRQVLPVIPALAGISFVLLVVFATVASAR